MTSYVPMLQAEYRSFVKFDNCVGLLHLSCLRKKQSSLFFIMLVLSGVIQNKATYQNYNGLKTQLPKLLRESLIV